MPNTTIIYCIAVGVVCLVIGFLSGSLYTRRNDNEWRDSIISAFQMGMDRAERKIKSGEQK